MKDNNVISFKPKVVKEKPPIDVEECFAVHLVMEDTPRGEDMTIDELLLLINRLSFDDFFTIIAKPFKNHEVGYQTVVSRKSSVNTLKSYLLDRFINHENMLFIMENNSRTIRLDFAIHEGTVVRSKLIYILFCDNPR